MKFVPKDLKPYFKMSLAFHAGIFLVFGLKVLFFPDLGDLNDINTIKVDMVSLPDKDDNKIIPKPPKKIEKEKSVVKKKTKPKEEKKPESIPLKDKSTQKEKLAKKEKLKKKEESKNKGPSELEALAKLEELNALKKLKKVEDPKKSNNAGPIKGNRVNPGDSLVGITKIRYNNYIKVLQDTVKKNWDLPPWLQDGELTAEALIKIDKTGNLTTKELLKPSGNSIYDKYVIKTITNSSPFPPPPDKFINVVAIKGVVLSFN